MLISIEEAAKLLGVSKGTLRRWGSEGKIISERTPGGHRRHRSEEVSHMAQRLPSENERITIAYARVSKSGLNYHKKGLQALLQRIMRNDVDRLVITHKAFTI